MIEIILDQRTNLALYEHANLGKEAKYFYKTFVAPYARANTLGGLDFHSLHLISNKLYLLLALLGIGEHGVNEFDVKFLKRAYEKCQCR